MSESLYNGKPLDRLSDAEVLSLAGGFGPAVIGQALFDRAASIAQRTDGGRFGPAMIDPDYGKEKTSESDDPKTPSGVALDTLSRKALADLATARGVSHKSNASRQAIIDALMAAGVTEAPAEAGGGAE